MTPERFQQLVATYGTQRQRWPEAERNPADSPASAARENVSSSASASMTSGGAQQHWSDAQWLDQQLDLYQVEAPTDALLARILANVPAAPSATAAARAPRVSNQSGQARRGGFRWSGGRRSWLPGVGVLIGAGIAGIASGAMLVSQINAPAAEQGTAAPWNATVMNELHYGGSVFSNPVADLE